MFPYGDRTSSGERSSIWISAPDFIDRAIVLVGAVLSSCASPKRPTVGPIEFTDAKGARHDVFQAAPVAGILDVGLGVELP